MATTTNFGWTTPNDTDLVKDGAAAIRTALNGVDTSFVDLKGGTTGQVLAKASNTDLDYSWVAQDDSNAIQNAIVDAKGDLIAASANDTPARLAVGTNGQLLSADSTAGTGLAWIAAPVGKVIQVLNFTTATTDTSTSTTQADTSLTLSITPTLATSKVLVIVNQNGVSKDNSSAAAGVNLYLYRGATSLDQFSYNACWTNTALWLQGMSQSYTYLDSPATTSATTYKTRFRLQTAGGLIYCQSGNEKSSITLIEIGA